MNEKSIAPLESDLCDEFAGVAVALGWTVYPETAGWDLLCVRGDMHIGIQAKRRANLHVLYQALPSQYDLTRIGPDFRAVLVYDPGSLDRICSPLRIWVFGPPYIARGWDNERRHGGIGSGLLEHPEYHDDHRWEISRHNTLPPVIPTGSGGVPCPSPLSRWKIGALRLLARAQHRPVTSRDAKAVGISIQSMVQLGFLRPTGNTVNKFKTYVAGEDTLKRPDRRHPAEFASFLAEQSATPPPTEPKKE